MSTTETCRRSPICFTGIALVMISAAGCPSSSDESKDPNAPPIAAVQGPGRQQAAEAGPSGAGSTVPTDKPETRPTVEPHPPWAEPVAQPAAESDGPGRQPVGDPAVLPNPLRNVAAGNHGATTSRLRPGSPGEVPSDPIKENGPIFVGWPKPKLALVITGRQEGYLEPCGCAGDRMKGGMGRRHSLFEQLRKKKGWPVLGLDVGGLAKGYGRQAEIKFQTMVNGMRKMGYDAIALGKTDLRLPAGVLLAEAAGQESPFLSANVGLLGPPGEYTAQTRVIEAAGMKIAVTGVLGKQFQRTINNPEIVMTDPEAALAKVVPELNRRADYLILLAHATMKETAELARKFPDFDLVVTAGGAAEPPLKAQWINGKKTRLIEVGEKGMNTIVVAMFDDPKKPFRYQRVPLDARFPGSPEMKMLMKLYQDQLEDLGFQQLGIPLGDRSPPHPQRETGGKFVGSKECQSCHEDSYDVWKKSGHAKAYETLSKLDPPRQFDPECISCHVVGWHPTEYFPYQGGYTSLEKTPKLIAVGCESCHGPGGAHVAAENGSDQALKEKLAKATVITKAEAKDHKSGKQFCRACHNGDNSPDFDFDLYWPKVEHYEVEDEDQ